MKKVSKIVLAVFIISLAFSCSQEKSVIDFISERDWTDLTIQTIREGCPDFNIDSMIIPLMAFNDSAFNKNSELLRYRLSLRKKFLEVLMDQKEINIGRQLRVIERFESHIYFSVQASNGEFYLIEFSNHNDVTPRIKKVESYESFFKDSQGSCIDKTDFDWLTGLTVVSLISIDNAGLVNYEIISAILS